MSANTHKTRISLDKLSDFFGPVELARCLGISKNAGYALAKSDGFPSKRIGKKIIINKQAFLNWWNNYTA